MASESTARRFQRLLIEFAVIVVGVFVGVAAESWWSEREDRRFERELRDDMVAEFAANIEILEADLATNGVWSARFRGLADMEDAVLQSLTDAELTATYGVFPEWAAFDPAMGSVQALVQSGNLRAISDAELRFRMSHWSGLLMADRRFSMQASSFQIQELMGAIAAVIDDLRWTPAERRQVQVLYRTMVQLHGLVIRNQQQLLSEARAIHGYLDG